MSESTTPAKCSEQDFEAARAAGLLVVTSADEAAIHRFAEAVRANLRRASGCPMCHGTGKWRPAYSRSYRSCDLCDSRPSSIASATTDASPNPAGRRA